MYNAWALNLKGAGQVVEDWAVPAAHRLAEAGWLVRRIQDDQLTWWWSAKAETALDLSALVEEQSQN